MRVRGAHGRAAALARVSTPWGGAMEPWPSFRRPPNQACQLIEAWWPACQARSRPIEGASRVADPEARRLDKAALQISYETQELPHITERPARSRHSGTSTTIIDLTAPSTAFLPRSATSFSSEPQRPRSLQTADPGHSLTSLAFVPEHCASARSLRELLPALLFPPSEPPLCLQAPRGVHGEMGALLL